MTIRLFATLIILFCVTLGNSQTNSELLKLLDSSLQKNEFEAQKLADENHSLRARIDRLTAENKKLKKENRSVRENEKALEEAANRLLEIKKELEIRKIHSEIIESQINELKRENNNLTSQVSTLAGTKKSLEAELDSTRTKLYGLETNFQKQVRQARLRDIERNLRYPFGRPNPVKRQWSAYMAFKSSAGAMLSWERRKTLYGVTVGYDNYRFNATGLNMSWLHASAALRQYVGGDSLRARLGVNAHPFFHFEMGYPFILSGNKITQGYNYWGVMLGNIGIGMSFLIGENRILATSFNVKALNYRYRNDANDDVGGDTGVNVNLRVEFTFW